MHSLPSSNLRMQKEDTSESDLRQLYSFKYKINVTSFLFNTPYTHMLYRVQSNCALEGFIVFTFLRTHFLQQKLTDVSSGTTVNRAIAVASVNGIPDSNLPNFHFPYITETYRRKNDLPLLL